MRKLHGLMAAVVAVFAFGAIAATSAFAFTEFLAGGAKILAAEDLLFEISGELILHDLGASSKVLCSGVFDGLFLNGDEADINEILTLAGARVAVNGMTLTLATAAGNEVTCLPVEGPCENTGDTKVIALKLPWAVTLNAAGTGVLFEPEYNVDCLVFTLLTENTCSGDAEAEVLTDPGTGDAAFHFSETFGPEVTCDNGHVANAESDEADSVITDPSGALITIN